jgi:hypothetical protein
MLREVITHALAVGIGAAVGWAVPRWLNRRYGGRD